MASLGLVSGVPLGAPMASAAAGSFTPLSPARLLDTRPGQSTTDGQAAGGGAVGNGATLDLTVAGRGGVPASGVAAVAVNVTVTQPSQFGFLTVFPTGETRPTASNLNFVPGQTIPNLVVAKLGTAGKISLFNFAGSTHIIVDVLGWFPTGGDYNALSPARLADTRPGQTTVDGQSAGGGAVGSGATFDVTVAGRGGVPLNGAGAVAINVTVTQPSVASFLTVFPSGTTRPNASNLNYTPGVTIPNLVITKVGANGKVSLFNATGTTHVIVDVLGWFPTPGEFTALNPARLADTRPGQVTIDHLVEGGGAVTGGTHLALPVLNRGGVPATGVGAVVLNVTATQPSDAGFVTVYPGWESRPNASNLNFTANLTIPNLVIAKVGAGGKIDLFTNVPSAHLVVDVLGWFPGTDVAEPTATDVSGTFNSSCAVLTNHRVQCWGANDTGQLGTGVSLDPATRPDTVLGIDNANSVSAGDTHGCAVLSTGQVKCWGDNVFGQLGNGTTTDSATPVPVSGITNATAVVAGIGFSCALLSTGGVSCWGDNFLGQAGNGSTADEFHTPVTVTGVTTATQLSASGFHACVREAAGTVKCWGDNESGQIGNGTISDPNGDPGVRTPAAVSGLTGVTAVSAGFLHSCALLTGGTLQCWGENSSEELGNASAGSNSTTPVPVNGITNVTQVEAAVDETCALVGGGELCWGEGVVTPTAVPGLANVVDVAEGFLHTCAVVSGGQVKCLGDNSSGQLGNGTVVSSDPPVNTLIGA